MLCILCLEAARSPPPAPSHHPMTIQDPCSPYTRDCPVSRLMATCQIAAAAVQPFAFSVLFKLLTSPLIDLLTDNKVRKLLVIIAGQQRQRDRPYTREKGRRFQCAHSTLLGDNLSTVFQPFSGRICYPFRWRTPLHSLSHLRRHLSSFV